MTDLTMVSLFDGIGGFPLAFGRAGVRTVAAVEIDPAAAGVVRDRLPGIAHFDDVTEVSADELRATGFVPTRGVLTAGWPCTDLSLAGLRAGLGAARSGLFWQVVRLASDLRPRWLVLENVPGLLSAVCPGNPDDAARMGGQGRLFGADEPDGLTHGRGACPGGCMAAHGGAMGLVLGALGGLGYGFAYRVLDAQHVGVPQRRRRVVIVGHLGDGAAPAEVLLEPASMRGDSAAGEQARSRTARVLAFGAGGGGGNGHGGTAPTLQDGGRRGYRVDAEMAAGGGLIGFDAAQITSGENRSNPRSGDPQPPLAATGAPHVAYAFRHTNGIDPQASTEATPTPRNGSAGHSVMEGGAGVSAVRRLTPV